MKEILIQAAKSWHATCLSFSLTFITIKEKKKVEELTSLHTLIVNP